MRRLNSSGPRGGTICGACAPVPRGTWSGLLLVLLWCLATLVAASDDTGGHVREPAYPPSAGSRVQVTPARPGTNTDSAAPLLSPVRFTVAPALTPPDQTARWHTVVTFADPSGNHFCTKLLGSDAYKSGECVCTGDTVDPTCEGVVAQDWPWSSMCHSLQLNRRQSVYFGDTLLGPVFPDHATPVSGRSMSSPLAEPCSYDSDCDSWYDDARASFRLVLHKSSPNYIPLSLMPVVEGDEDVHLEERLDFERQEYHQDQQDQQDQQQEAALHRAHADLDQSKRRRRAMYHEQLDEQQRQEDAYAQEQRQRHRPSGPALTLRAQEEEEMQREYEQHLRDLEAQEYELDACAHAVLEDDGSCSPAFACPDTATGSDKNLDTLDGFMRAADSSADLDAFRRPTPPEEMPDVDDTVDLEEPDIPSYEHTGTDQYESMLHRQVYAYLFWNQYPLKLQGKGTNLSRKRKTFAQNARRRYKVQLCPRTNEMELFHIRDGNLTTKRKESRSITSVAQAKWHNLRMVPKHADSLRLVKSLHEANHQGHNILQARLSQKFFIPGLSQKCMDVSGGNCSVCSTHAAVRKKPANAILTSRRGELVMFDLTKFYAPVHPACPACSSCLCSCACSRACDTAWRCQYASSLSTCEHAQQNSKGVVWMLIVVDHFTKFVWAKEFESKEAQPIAEFLFSIFTDGVCVPERWHADNGGEFKNHYIDAVRELLSARGHGEGSLLPYTHGLPRNPECQGIVERANRTLKTWMHKAIESDGGDVQETCEWVPYLHAAVRNHNRTPVKMYGRVCPSELMNGCPPEAPDHQTLTPSELVALHAFCARKMEDHANKRLHTQAQELPEFQPNDIVHVLQLKKRSHADKAFKGSKQWTGRAIVVSRSATSENHYQIQWISDGLVGREKAGSVSNTLWLSWRMKLATRQSTDPTVATVPHMDATAISKSLRASASSRSSTSSTSRPVQTKHASIDTSSSGPSSPAEKISELASRSSHATICACSTIPCGC